MIKIDAQNVDFYYGDFHALKNISMQIEQTRRSPLSDRPVVVNPPSCAYSTG